MRIQLLLDTNEIDYVGLISNSICFSFHFMSNSTKTKRQLFPTGLRHSICSLDGLLFDSDLHPIEFDCRHLLGFVLDQPQRCTGQGLVGRHDGAHHDDAHVVDQRPIAKNLLRQIHRYLPRNLFRHGLCFTFRYVRPSGLCMTLYITLIVHVTLSNFIELFSYRGKPTNRTTTTTTKTKHIQ